MKIRFGWRWAEESTRRSARKYRQRQQRVYEQIAEHFRSEEGKRALDRIIEDCRKPNFLLMALIEKGK
jgi:ubiquinone biosynthesis protein UbiJ